MDDKITQTTSAPCTIGATYDVLCKTESVGEARRCKLCLSVSSLKHILSECKNSLTWGCYTWRHNQVLKSFVRLFENKLIEVNSLPVNDSDSRIYFV